MSSAGEPQLPATRSTAGHGMSEALTQHYPGVWQEGHTFPASLHPLESLNPSPLPSWLHSLPREGRQEQGAHQGGGTARRAMLPFINKSWTTKWHFHAFPVGVIPSVPGRIHSFAREGSKDSGFVCPVICCVPNSLQHRAYSRKPSLGSVHTSGCCAGDETAPHTPNQREHVHNYAKQQPLKVVEALKAGVRTVQNHS